MRICHVITKPELGGAQLNTSHLISNLSAHGYNISIITSPYGILKHEFKNIKNITCYFSKFLIRPLNFLYDIWALIDIYNICKKGKFILVHTHSSKAGIIGRCAAWLARTKYIVHTVHGWSFNSCQNPLVKWLFIFLEKMAATITTKIICVSEKDIERGLGYNIAPKEKFVLIRYGIDIDVFRKASNNISTKKKELGIYNDDPVVGMISCLKPQKSPIDFIKAAIDIYKEIPHVNFLLVGDGVLKNRCKAILQQSSLNGRFIFAGWRRDISELLDIFDVTVLTSKWEGMPIAIIEALCKGCPVVVTDVGGAQEIVKNGINGYITRPGAYKDTAEKVKILLKNKDMLARMKKEALISIDDSFDIKNMVNRIDSLYRSLA